MPKFDLIWFLIGIAVAWFGIPFVQSLLMKNKSKAAA
jgi:hypothetical protein